MVLQIIGTPCSAGADNTSATEAKTPPAGVRQKLLALEPGRGLVLGKAAVLGEFNDVARDHSLDRTGPRGRDFSVKMVWAPDRDAALFLGANHGSPHRLNDVWEFDLDAMAWRMLYASDNSRSYAGLGKDMSDVLFKDGVLVTKRGGPAVIGHTWWGMAYDWTDRQILYMNTWATDQDKAILALGGDPMQRYKGPPLWSFDPTSKSWGAIKSNGPYPRAPFAGFMEYVEPLGGVVWHSNHWQMRATWLFRTRSGEWEKLAEHGKEVDYLGEVPRQEQVGYYDPIRRILVLSSGTRTSHFDVIRKRWRKIIDEPEGSDHVPDAHDARTPMYFDPKSGHGILVDLKSSRIWGYDPDRGAWSNLQIDGDPMPSGKKQLAYFDANFNVVVVLTENKVWVYRYQG
ncbi:hypothetical protein ACNQFN_18130 [Thauera butanivorans]|uniref:hypothetical protein n=1 Tax=Thauera butanivorans TaxID=86174 RepID=UPI003AB23EC1